MNFSPIQFDSVATSRYGSLFSSCFPQTTKFNANYLKWLYQENPEGLALGFDAWDNNNLAAHYACIPLHAQIGGKIVKILLSLNTATHPNYQGKGLFTRLAELTYETAADNGFDGICGVANANSTPGFVRKLGFQLVEPLQARIGIGQLNIDSVTVVRNAQFKRIWQLPSLVWRCANPNNTISSRVCDDRTQFYAPAVGRLLPAYAELILPNTDYHVNKDAIALSPCRLYLGLEPSGSVRSSLYFDIPQQLRPSPLNFIYRPLTTRVDKLERGSISFSFLDFDAY